jgi:hypothetical protein
MNWTYLLVALASWGASGPLVDGKPEVTHVGLAAPDVIVVMIAVQSIEHGKQVPYEAQPGDEIVNWRQHRYVRRGDARIGALVGAEGKMLCTPDRLVGEPLDTAAIDRIETYLRTTHQGVNREMQQTILAALLRDAERDLRNTEATDFHWTGGPARQISWGAMSKPESQNLVRAHFMTGDEKYLRAVILSTLSGAGANPLNMCYVTGVGSTASALS